MAARNKTIVKIEHDIEKNREECNWVKVLELADQLSKSWLNSSVAPLCSFLCGEARLELYLQDNPPFITKREGGFEAGDTMLLESKKDLLDASSEAGKKAGVALDSHLLLGKLFYTIGNYEEALSHFYQAELHALTEKSLPSRSIKIVAESYAIKGLCLEKLPPFSSSKYKQAEYEDQMIHCFETAGDLALLYLQENDKQQQQVNLNSTSNPPSSGSHSPQPSINTNFKSVGIILETALQRAPLLYIKSNKLAAAVTCYRNWLSAIEATGTHALRLSFTRQLAELILRGVSGKLYTAPPNPAIKKNTGNPWKPQTYYGVNLFIPRNEFEEVLLLLIISEAMAVKEAVLSQSPEFKDARIRAFRNATAIYDLLTVILTKWSQFSLLKESLERALKFSYGEAHVWVQYALCLDSMGHFDLALNVLDQVARLTPTKVLPCLLAARMCFQNLNKLAEGIKWVQKALSREQAHPQNLLSRCYLFLGIGYHYSAVNTHVKNKSKTFHSLSQESFLNALKLDPNDHITYYYLGLHAACHADTTEAINYVKQALKLNPEHTASINLMILLLTAQKQVKESLALVESSLMDFPDNLNFSFLKANIELHHVSGEAALQTARHMLTLWKNLYEDQTNSEISDNKSVFQLYTSELSDKDTNSVHTHSLIAAKVEQALSDIASSISSFAPRPGPHKAWQIQLQIWLLLAEIYLTLDQINAATACIQEATHIFPLSHHITYTRGLLHEKKNEFQEAKQCYLNAVSINPYHIKSLQQLGLMYHYLGNQRLAEKTLRDAAKIDPHSPLTWYNLGKVLEAIGDSESATDCMATALEVENNSPILPYMSIAVTFD
ncbi:hypothetical protein M8J76_017120 [Diaphorina citri]|nr:hypothetical protein M8J76_017120 [Diaphorina citri]KAI5731062.1 hypothetical protein M8J77_004005 [Diaphorina citri]